MKLLQNLISGQRKALAPPNDVALKEDFLPHADHLQLTYHLPPRHVYTTLGHCHSRMVPELGEFPMPQVLKIWNTEGERMNCMVEGASPGNNEITQSQASETMARFLRASNPGLGVIRVSSYYHYPLDDLDSSLKKSPELALLRIVSSLISNLVSLLPERFPAHPDLCEKRFLQLQFGSSEAGIKILRALPKLHLKWSLVSRKKLLVIIDGISAAFNEYTETLCYSLLDALEQVASQNKASLIFTDDNDITSYFQHANF